MRELKFRMWANGHWVDWIPTCKTLGAYNASIIDTDGYTFEGDNPVIVEQYTGLTDKNGKEIYEGDILWWEHFYGMTGENIETTAEVYWEEKDASFVVGDWFEPLGHLVDEDEVEVIGNIHESNMEELCPKE